MIESRKSIVIMHKKLIEKLLKYMKRNGGGQVSFQKNCVRFMM